MAPQGTGNGGGKPRALQLHDLGQSIWYDNIRRGLIDSGELGHKIRDLGVLGLTSNPTIFQKAIAKSTDYDGAIAQLVAQGKRAGEIYDALTIADIQAACDLLRPAFDATGGVDGRASIEVPPAMCHDTDASIAEGRRLWQAVDRQNVMIKIPATPEGIPAIRALLAEGIPVNITLIFSAKAYADVMEAYQAALEDRVARGLPVDGVTSVASFFVSRVDSAVDKLLEAKGTPEARALLGKVAIANAKDAYQQFLETFASPRFQALKAKGARVQRPLWASTSTKNPAYPDTLYVDHLIGADTVNTVPEETLVALDDHATVKVTITEGLDDVRRTLDALPGLGIDLQAVLRKLLDEGLKSFADSYDQLFASLEEKSKAVAAR